MATSVCMLPSRLSPTLLAVGALVLADLASAEVSFPRHPAPSPDGSQIAFSWQGDVWVCPADGGTARRLTVHPGYDTHPIWSRDGTRLAFTSDRRGNDDVYVMPVTGGAVTALTYYAGSDRATDFTHDDAEVLFISARDLYDFRQASVYGVPTGGGTPVRRLDAAADAVAVDGQGWLVFARGSNSGYWWRTGYRGPGARRLWRAAPDGASGEELFHSDAQDMLPSWSSALGATVFLSESDGTYNVWMVGDDGQATQITRFDGEGARFPRVARDAALIAFEYELSIWTVTPGASPRAITIDAPGDSPVATEERLTVQTADELAVSPDGKEIAIVHRGEIFVRRIDEDASELTRVTRHPARDHDISWTPDSKSLVFISDRHGQPDIYQVRADDDVDRLVYARRHAVSRLTETDDFESRPSPSPDGKLLGFVRNQGDLVVADSTGRGARVIATGFQRPDFDWSPDSRWLAFTRTDDDFNTDIYVGLADGSDDPVNVTRHPDAEAYPTWSPDGRKLLFTGTRSYSGDSDVFLVWLRQEDDEKTVREILDEDAIQAARDDAATDEEADDEEADETEDDDAVEVVIDFEDIHRRLHRITRFPGDESRIALTDDGQTIIFTAQADGERDVWKVRWDGEERERLTRGNMNPGHLQWCDPRSRAFFLSSGKIKSVDTSSKTKSYASSGRMRVDVAAERAQIFDEAWRTLDQAFYDRDHHDANWDEMRKRYRRYTDAAAHPDDFRDAMRLMIGSLNSSHQQIYDPPSSGGIDTGTLGIRARPLESGAIEVAEVMPMSPAARASSRLEVGDVITAIDRTSLQPGDNYHQLLEDTVGQRVMLNVRSADDETREVDIRPEGRRAFRDRVYERDVRWRRSLVDDWGDGKLGYINLRHMGSASASQFENELYAVAHGMDGLIIDVRDNSGGWVTDILLTSLLAGNHAYTVPREGGVGYPAGRRLIFAWTKPIVVLSNETTFSNGEIFCWAVQTLGRGTTVGQPTFGGVISTGGHRLLDGSRVRTPFRGWYVNREGPRVNMERTPFVPDILVDASPFDYAARRDPQLRRAVEELRKQL